ncbi:calmodulin-binding protein 60 F-like isoform X2 [Panicum virgatum]|uniref:calmodulin-binding protein 60 F-like isoform X2 n=1 Tax=Panicum virgatum TaxID=38727 RepID=UPI0019D63B82|nr:calmodulin-binding protein 60 F-like isoform X2 [Panicum virgatum]
MAPKRELFVAAGDGGAALPQEKRLRVEAAPGSSSSRPNPPSSPRHFLAIVLVVLFLKRPKGRSTDAIAISASKFGRMMRDQICRFINPLFSKLENMDSKLETMGTKLGRMEEQIQDITVKVDNIARPSPDHHNHEQFRQETNQEVKPAEAEGLASTEGKGENTSIRLRFLNGMNTQVYHDDEIKSDRNTAISIGIFNGEKMIESGELSNVQIEIFALEGDFPYASPKSWTAKKFNKHRANARDGRGNVLAGEGIKAQLKNGQCDLGSIKFTENSSKAHRGKFIIGARVCEGEVCGFRVQEAVMDPVVVQDRRNKFNEKRHLPKLNDPVHRLKEIAKDGIYCKRLEKEKILTVQDFLKALNKDPENLAKVLQIKKEHRNWEKMVEHARKCPLRRELTSYHCPETKIVLFFNCVHGLVGAEFDGRYTACAKFDQDQQDLVDKLKGSAYDQLDALRPDYVMTETDNFPRPLTAYIGGAGSSAGAGPSNMPSDSSGPLAAYQVAGVPAVESSSHTQIESSIANTNMDPSPSSSIPYHHSAHQYQDIPAQGTQPGQEQFSTSLNGSCQEPVGQPNSCSWTTKELYHGDEHNEVGHFLNQAGFNKVDIQSSLLWLGNDTLEASTPSLGCMMLTPQQPAAGGAPASAQGSMQSQMQAPLLQSNDTSVASASAQQALPPQEWFSWSDLI